MTSRSRQGTLKFNIVGDISDLKSKLGQIERSTRSTSDKLGNVGRAVAAGFSVATIAKIGQVVGELRDLGVEADNIRNKFDIVFGEGADDVAVWADEVNERFGLSQIKVQELAADFADLLVPIGFTREAATGLSTDALTLANALSEWSGGNISVADSADRIRKALLGEREGLKALNVSILQSDLNARLAAEGNDKLTGAEKARAEAEATLAIITEKSADALDAYADNTNDALIAQKALTAAQQDGKQALADFVENEVSSFNDEMGALGIILGEVTDKLNDLNQSTEEGAESQRGLIETGLRYVPWLRSTFEALDDVVAKQAEQEEAQRRSNEATQDGIGISAGYAAGLEVVETQAGETAGAIKQTADEIKALQQAERAATDPIFALRQANEKLNEAFEKRVELQAQGAPSREVTEAINDELEAAQDLEFARQNLNTAGTDGLDILEQYAERYAIGAEQVAAYRREVEGLANALNGLPASINIPTVTSSDTVRRIEEELARRGSQVVID